MDFKSNLPTRILRVIAMLALMMGLADAARLVGLGDGDRSPLAILGVTGFTWLGVFCVTHLCASVGLWIKASWGAVTLVGACLMALILTVSGSPDFRVDLWGALLRVVIIVVLGGLMALNLRARLQHD
jgi:hypothetical protein